MGFETFPSEAHLKAASLNWPDFMRPNTTPYAAWYEGFLSDELCDEIVAEMHKYSAYKFKGCGGLTRECHEDPVLDVIEQFARFANSIYWEYDLDPGQHSWFQTYTKGNEYQAHMDGEAGQTRKLTAVALLSDPSVYDGGNLRLLVEPKVQWVPRTRGTIVVFQPWMVHEVLPVSSGLRQTLNMGFWGPSFR